MPELPLNENEEEEKDKLKQQNDRAFLRERFLRFLLSLNGNEADIVMQENTRVSGKLMLSDLNFENLMVKDLRTPIGTLPHALLRIHDVLSFSIHKEEV
ncbi:hypothetical protein Ahia01_001201500 [Argonauta hians]